MPAPLAVSFVARVVLSGVLAAAITAAVGWMINEIHQDDERQRQRRTREGEEEERARERNADAG